MRIYLPISLFFLVLFSCGSQRELTKSNNEIVSKRIENHLYNSDSSHYIVIKNKDVADGLKPIFILVKANTRDTLFVSKGDFEFIEWKDNSKIKLLKRTGLPEKNTPINEHTKNSNIFFLDIRAQEISPQSTLKN